MAVQSPSQQRLTLSPAERRIVVALCDRGESNPELAARLGCRTGTIKFHLMSAMWIAGVTNRTALALWWIRAGQYIDKRAEE